MKKRIPLEKQPVGMFVVMRHSDHAKRMHFSVLHASYDGARAEAQRLAAESIAEHGPGYSGYYILQILGRVGVFDDMLDDGARRV